MGTPGRKPISQEKRDLAARLLDEGWPFQEITRTHGISYHSLAKYFPGRQWTNKEAAEHGVLVRKMKMTEPAKQESKATVRIAGH